MRTRQSLSKKNYNTKALVKTRLSNDTEGFEQGFNFYLGGYYRENACHRPISGVSKTN